jgi:hypothetical protein
MATCRSVEGRAAQARVKRCGKSAPAAGVTRSARQTPPGARPSRGDGLPVPPDKPGEPPGRPQRWMITPSGDRRTEPRLQADSSSPGPLRLRRATRECHGSPMVGRARSRTGAVGHCVEQALGKPPRGHSSLGSTCPGSFVQAGDRRRPDWVVPGRALLPGRAGWLDPAEAPATPPAVVAGAWWKRGTGGGSLETRTSRTEGPHPFHHRSRPPGSSILGSSILGSSTLGSTPSSPVMSTCSVKVGAPIEEVVGLRRAPRSHVRLRRSLRRSRPGE